MNCDENRADLYRGIFQKPLEEIQEDIFFRADNFQDEPWYEDIMIFTRIGVCQPKPEHALEVQKALKIMGYSTHTFNAAGKLYVAGGEKTAP